MNSEQNIDFSLLISMLIHMLSVAIGVVLFTKPFVKRKIAAYMSGISYMAVMLVMYLVPAEFDNIIAYGAGVTGAFLCLTLIDRRNIPQKIFLCFSFFSIRWITGVISTATIIPINNFLFSGIIPLDEKGLALALALSDIADLIVYLVFICLAVILFNKVYKCKNEKMTYPEAVILSMPSLLGCLTYRVFLYFNSTDYSVTGVSPYETFSIVYCIISFLSILALVYFYEQMKRMSRKEKYNALTVSKAERIKSYVTAAEELYRNIRSVKHDMVNHIAVLESLHSSNKNDEFDRYLDKIKTQINDSSSIKSGNPITDIILNGKKTEAEKDGIDFICGFAYPECKNADPFDISIILNNILDNGICAAAECENPYLKITSGMRKNAFLITCENSFCGDIRFTENGLPETQKSDSENHGFGLENVRTIAEKYNGGIDISTENGRFIINVMLIVQT